MTKRSYVEAVLRGIQNCNVVTDKGPHGKLSHWITTDNKCASVLELHAALTLSVLISRG